MADKWIQLMSEDGTDNLFPTSKMDLLWENANTSVQFTAQTLTINGLSDYSMVAIYIRGSLYRNAYFLQWFFVDKGDVQLMFGSYDHAVTANTTRTVTFNATSNQITFSASSDANTMIPYQIYGIR